MELYMKYVKTVAVCAVVALGVGATSATAGTLMTSAKIKDGTIKMRDLSPSLQAKINRAGQPGPQGAQGAPGANGVNGAPGANGQPGANGKDGLNGRDGVRYDRIVGSCAAGTTGEVAVAGGVARLGAPEQMSWAQIRSYPKGLTVSELEQLSFRSTASDPGVVYMKITVEGHGSILFSPNTQPGGEQGLGDEWATHDVLDGTVRLNDDAGFTPDVTWAEVLAEVGNKHVKDVRVTAGCANPVGDDGALVQVDDLTINDEVIDFS
jgi:Collagen triple helix repeat (20 copies)